MHFALVTRRHTPTNDALGRIRHELGAWEPMTPDEALAELEPGDVALGRLDVLPTLDGIDDGLWALGALAARGVAVLNEPAALLAAHDKLLTAGLLRRNGIPHPRTLHVRNGRPIPAPAAPVVVKPRFGSWGEDVYRCEGLHELHETLALVRTRGWYERHGALVQDLVPPQGYDLRVVIAAGHVIGAVFRVAAEGEWRTNVALGAVRKPISELPRDACEIALAASRAAGTALVGVDLLPDGRGGWHVLELNGAVEFSPEYAPFGDVFSECAALLAQAGAREVRGSRPPRWAAGRT